MTASARSSSLASLANHDCHRVRLLLHKDGGLKIKAVSCSCPGPVGVIEKESEVLPLLVMSSSHTDPTDPFYYHKTTCRSLYDTEREKAVAAGFFDVLFCNERGEVTEGSITNVFIRREGKLLTPPTRCGLLGGVLRSALLAGEVMVPDSLHVVEEVLTVRDLRESEAIYVGNSVRGLIRAKLADDELG